MLSFVPPNFGRNHGANVTKQLFVASAEDSLDANSTVLSILIVEDDPGDFGLLDVYLRQAGFRSSTGKSVSVWVKTLADGIATARRQRPDVILLDLSLPDSVGLRTVEAMVAALPDVPIVVLTGLDDSQLAMAALEAGAQDYLVKGQFDSHALQRGIHHARARAKLESRLRLFEVALSAAANGIVITDSDGCIQWANPAFVQMTGFSLEEAKSHNPKELVKSGKQDQAFYQRMWETILSGQEWQGEVVNRRKDGSLYDEALTISPVSDASGSIRHFVAIKQDITERKLAEQQLRQSEERLELALSGSDLGMWDIHVPSGNMVANARWYEMLGYRADEIAPTLANLVRLVHPDDLSPVQASFMAHLHGETPVYAHEYRMRHKSGHWAWVLTRGKVVSRDDQGNPLRVTGTTLDISSQKRLNLEGGDLLKRIEALIRAASERSGAPVADGKTALPQLSDRQTEVLKLVASGCTSAEIAERLNIKPATVVTHRRDLMRNLDLHSVAALTRYAIEHGLISGK
jgi:PAS domain S-box-containing protein